jgi:hypothetical protein
VVVWTWVLTFNNQEQLDEAKFYWFLSHQITCNTSF